MALLSVVRSIDGVVFDATIKEDHESELEIVDNPVEFGVSVSDHAYMGPLRLTVRAGVTDTPLSTPPNDFFNSDTSRSRKAFEYLRQLQANAEPFTVVSGLTVYENMLCKRLSTSQDKDSANTFDFTAEFREVIIRFTQSVTYPARAAGKTTRQASLKQNKGQVQGTVVTDAETKKKSSLIQKLRGWKNK